jgi:hypothetical protein
MVIDRDGPAIRLRISEPAPRCALFAPNFHHASASVGRGNWGHDNGTNFSLILGQVYRSSIIGLGTRRSTVQSRSSCSQICIRLHLNGISPVDYCPKSLTQARFVELLTTLGIELILCVLEKLSYGTRNHDNTLSPASI